MCKTFEEEKSEIFYDERVAIQLELFVCIWNEQKEKSIQNEKMSLTFNKVNIFAVDFDAVNCIASINRINFVKESNYFDIWTLL